jgi:hypothetical protein
MIRWLVWLLGIDNEAGRPYAFWSGFGGSIPDFLILGGLITMYRKHNCHDKGCWRIGKHTVDGTPWCSRHHQAARDRQVTT